MTTTELPSYTRQRRHTDPINWDRNSAISQGLDPSSFGALGCQVILDLYECQSNRLDDLEWVRQKMLALESFANTDIGNESFYQLPSAEVSGLMTIGGSQVTVRTWPQYHCVAVDVLSCETGLDLAEAAQYLIDVFGSQEPHVFEVLRGRAE